MRFSFLLMWLEVWVIEWAFSESDANWENRLK